VTLDLASVATEVQVTEAEQTRWIGFDPDTGATLYFGTLVELNEWSKGESNG
jgi:hypothetical protein